MRSLFSVLVFLGLLFPTAVASGQTVIPIFDSHSHFKSEEAGEYSPADIVALLDQQKIERMVIVGEPAGRAMSLYQYAPERFVPFLGLYRSYLEKGSWMFDSALPARMRSQLEKASYAGIGEVHIFTPQKNSPVFKQIVALADEYNLPLLLHGDAAVIEQVFEWFPDMQIIWAHLGTQPEPEVIHEMLTRYPAALFIDTSVRDERFEANGELKPEWRALFIEHADRLLVGIDTYSLQRWQRMDQVTRRIRHWLDQLPVDVARKLAYENARGLFGKD